MPEPASAEKAIVADVALSELAFRKHLDTSGAVSFPVPPETIKTSEVADKASRRRHGTVASMSAPGDDACTLKTNRWLPTEAHSFPGIETGSGQAAMRDKARVMHKDSSADASFISV